MPCKRNGVCKDMVMGYLLGCNLRGAGVEGSSGVEVENRGQGRS